MLELVEKEQLELFVAEAKMILGDLKQFIRENKEFAVTDVFDVINSFELIVEQMEEFTLETAQAHQAHKFHYMRFAIEYIEFSKTPINDKMLTCWGNYCDFCRSYISRLGQPLSSMKDVHGWLKQYKKRSKLEVSDEKGFSSELSRIIRDLGD